MVAISQGLRPLYVLAVAGASCMSGASPVTPVQQDGSAADAACVDTVSAIPFDSAGGCFAATEALSGICANGPLSRGTKLTCAIDSDGKVYLTLSATTQTLTSARYVFVDPADPTGASDAGTALCGAAAAKLTDGLSGRLNGCPACPGVDRSCSGVVDGGRD